MKPIMKDRVSDKALGEFLLSRLKTKVACTKLKRALDEARDEMEADLYDESTDPCFVDDAAQL
jgi:hypothetical protein